MLLISAITAGLLAFGLVYFELQYNSRTQKYNEVQQNVFAMGFSVIAIGFCLYWYTNNWYRSKRMMMLSLPVSAFERTLLTFAWMSLLFVVWYILIFFVVNQAISKWAISYEYQVYQRSPLAHLNQYLPSERMKFLNPFLINSMAVFMLLQTLLLASLLWFKRFVFVKSIVVVFLAAICYTWFHHSFIPAWLTPAGWLYDDSMIRLLKDSAFTEYDKIEVAPIWTALNSYHLAYTWVMLWAVIYFRIKEQEV